MSASKVACKFHPDAVLIEDYRAGDQICSECGLVVGDRVIDVGSEWRTFSNDKGGEDKSRVGGAEQASHLMATPSIITGTVVRPAQTELS